MAFADRLREIMEIRGINQTDLARLVGVRSQAVTQWANVRTHPRGKRLEQIATALDVSSSDLMLPAGSPIPPTSGPQIRSEGANLVRELAAWRDLYLAMEPDERPIAFRLIKRSFSRSDAA